jgi:phospholipid/cholesterol/gamma-HCH transport system permease protein
LQKFASRFVSTYVRAVEQGTASLPELSRRRALLWRATTPPSFANFIGRKLLRFLVTIQGLGAFALITIGVMFTKFGAASRVIHPLVRAHLSRSGFRLLPMTLFVSLALGLVVIGQTVSILQRVASSQQYLGLIMVTVVVRELGPLLTALIVLSRVGTANVMELGTARALGEIEALEVLGIDPIHYLVVPRVIGMAFGMFALTVYLILGALCSGYLWAFLQDIPLRPGDYLAQLAGSLRVLDFVTLSLKTILFGLIISTVTCYHGLAQRLRLEEVSGATIRAVAQSVILCVFVDGLFILLYLVA